jgi:hypothetical protein
MTLNENGNNGLSEMLLANPIMEAGNNYTEDDLRYLADQLSSLGQWLRSKLNKGMQESDPFSTMGEIPYSQPFTTKYAPVNPTDPMAHFLAGIGRA